MKPSCHLASMSWSGVLVFGHGEESGLLALGSPGDNVGVDEGCMARSGTAVLSHAAVGVGVAHEGVRGLAMHKPEVQHTCKVPVSLLGSVPVRGPGVGGVVRHGLNNVDGVEVSG
jgi:hypothetical protein